MDSMVSMPISTCWRTKFWVTALSDWVVLIPSEIIGLSEMSSNAPVGIRLANPTVKMVAVSMSMARARVFTKYSLNRSSNSQTRLFVV